MGRGAFDRRAQVRAALGDIDALRAVFEGPDGEALRRASDLEGPVLEAVLRERAPLALLGVFFRELRGRALTADYALVVYAQLLWADERFTREEPAVVAPWFARVAEVVHYLVATVGLAVPLHATLERLVYDGAGETLLTYARERGLWASYAALAEPTTDDLMALLLPYDPTPYNDYAAKTLGARLLAAADGAMLELLLRFGGTCRYRGLVNAEIERQRAHARALFMLPAPTAPGRGVQDNPELAQLILQMASAEL